MNKGYTINYERVERYQRPKQRKFGIPQFLLFLFITIAAISLFLPGTKQALLSILIPGNDQVTVDAAYQLTDQLQKGENAADALVTFCRIILENGS